MTQQNSSNDESHLRKIIDIPRSIVEDLKKLAGDANSSVKGYIQDLLVMEVERKKNHEGEAHHELRN